jgi:hypothetical protein
MGSVLKCLHNSFSSVSELLFYRSIVETIKYLTPKAKADFKLYHNEVVSHLLARRLSSRRLAPQYFLYFSALLQIFVKSSEDESLLKIIAQNIDNLNSNCKKLILTHHYSQFVFYLECPSRKAAFLNIKHYRKTNSQYTARFFIKKTIKKKAHLNFEKRLASMLGRKISDYHKNMDNLKKGN